jgi:hypothetical protein
LASTRSRIQRCQRLDIFKLRFKIDSGLWTRLSINAGIGHFFSLSSNNTCLIGISPSPQRRAAVLQMQKHNLVMVLGDVIHRIGIRRREMPNVQIDADQVRLLD